MKLSVDKPQGFIVRKNPVVICDAKGRHFYSTENIKKPVKAFNLPVGDYQLVKGKIAPLDRMVSYNLSKLPKPERSGRKNPDNFDIEFGDNPNKCSVLWNDEKIIFDKEFAKTLTIPELYFILFHEYGHRLYSTEKLCDLFSSNMMLKKGYNPSQIMKASLSSLHDRNYDRKKFLIYNMLKK